MADLSLIKKLDLISEFDDGQFDLSRGLILTYPKCVCSHRLLSVMNGLTNLELDDIDVFSFEEKIAIIIDLETDVVINRRDVVIDNIKPIIGIVINVDQQLSADDRRLLLGLASALHTIPPVLPIRTEPITGRMTVAAWSAKMQKSLAKELLKDQLLPLINSNDLIIMCGRSIPELIEVMKLAELEYTLDRKQVNDMTICLTEDSLSTIYQWELVLLSDRTVKIIEVTEDYKLSVNEIGHYSKGLELAIIPYFGMRR